MSSPNHTLFSTLHSSLQSILDTNRIVFLDVLGDPAYPQGGKEYDSQTGVRIYPQAFRVPGDLGESSISSPHHIRSTCNVPLTIILIALGVRLIFASLTSHNIQRLLDRESWTLSLLLRASFTSLRLLWKLKQFAMNPLRRHKSRGRFAAVCF